MNSRRAFFVDSSLNIIWLALFYGIFIVPAVLFLESRIDVLLLVSFILSWALLFMRRLIRPIVPMILAHLTIPIGAFFLAPDIYTQVLYIGVAAVLAIFSLQQRHTRSASFTAGFSFGAPVMLIAFAIFLGTQGYDYMIIYAVLIVFTSVCSKLHIRMVHVNDSLEVITQTSTQPVKKILAFDYKAMVVLSVVIVGMIIFLHVFLVRPILEAVSEININFQLDPLPPYQDYIQEPDDAMIPDLAGAGLEYIPYSGPWLLWRILEWLLVLLVPPAVVLGVGYFIFRLVRGIYRQLGMKSDKKHEHASGYEDIKEFIRPTKSKRSWLFGRRGEHKLRRLFRETMTRHMKKGVPIEKTDTPMQMAGKIKAEDTHNLADEYAAVRYGK